MSHPVKNTFLTALIVIFGITSCTVDAKDDPQKPDPEPKDQPAKTTDDLLEPSVSRNMHPDADAVDITELVEGNTDFALDLYQQLVQDNDNLIFSPYSISMALAMTYAGAVDGTKTDMAGVLNFTLDDETLHAAFNSVDLTLNDLGSDPERYDGEPFNLNIANSLWLAEGIDLNPEFLDVLGYNYGAGLAQLDFYGDPEGTADTVNDWIEDKTEGRITDVVQAERLRDLFLLIVNAIYFKANWAETFSEYGTRDETFHAFDGDVTVPMMHLTHGYGYTEGNGYQAISIPYVGLETSMVILLSESGKFEDFEAGLDAETVSGIIDDMNRREVRLSLPKFEFDTSVMLSETLKAMGMASAFESGFDKMLLDPSIGSVFISEVIHKAFVSVDEEGTEAAAVTVVEMGLTAMPGDFVEPVEFTCDRPFIFLIVEESTQSVLFIGRVLNPM